MRLLAAVIIFARNKHNRIDRQQIGTDSRRGCDGEYGSVVSGAEYRAGLVGAQHKNTVVFSRQRRNAHPSVPFYSDIRRLREGKRVIGRVAGGHQAATVGDFNITRAEGARRQIGVYQSAYFRFSGKSRRGALVEIYLAVSFERKRSGNNARSVRKSAAVHAQDDVVAVAQTSAVRPDPQIVTSGIALDGGIKSQISCRIDIKYAPVEKHQGFMSGAVRSVAAERSSEHKASAGDLNAGGR